MTAHFVSVRDAASALGVSERLVYDLTDAGVLPCVRLGARKVIPSRAIDLVVERALAGFDPNAVLVSLAGAAGPSSAVGVAGDIDPAELGAEREEGSTAATGCERRKTPTPPASRAGPVAVTRP